MANIQPSQPDLIITKCCCETSLINISDYPELEALLPDEFKYHVCQMSRMDEYRFISRFRVNASTKEEALVWFNRFQLSSCTVFNKDRTFRENTTNVVYKVEMKCHHNTRPLSRVKRPDSRHTQCPARLAITVRRVKLSRNYQSTDIHLKEFPTVVILHHKHNHAIDYATEKRFLDRLKPKVFTPLLKQPNGPQMVQYLQSYVANYNAERNGRYSELIIHDEENFSVTLVSPLMKRVLESVPGTSEVLFADSTVKIESYGCKLFIFLSNSSFGGLPVGCILTTSDRQDVFLSALENFKSFLNSACFDGRGVLGPKVILTDERGSGKSSFSIAFPDATLHLCTFRVLQAAWRFTMDDNTGIPRERRLDFFCLIQEMIYSQSKEQLACLFENITNCPSTVTYPKFISYVIKMYTSKEEWAKCFIGESNTKDQHTSGVCESSMRLIHDSILKWKKAPSITELFHCIASDIESFFESHLITTANGRPISYLKRSFKTDNFSSEKVGSNSYIIRSTKTNRLYCVDSKIRICSCPNGKFGGMCKHQILISNKYNEGVVSAIDTVVDPARQAHLLFLATGQNDVPDLWTPSLPIDEKEVQEEMGGNVEIDSTSDTSSVNSDVEEMFGDEPLNEVEIAADDISPTHTDQMPWTHDLLLTSEQNDDRFLSISETTQRQDMFDNEQIAEISAESSRSNSAYGEMNAPEINSKRREIRSQLKAVFDDILLKTEESSETLEAVEEFIKSYCGLNSRNSLNTAFRNFGKFCGSFADETGSSSQGIIS